MARKKKPEPTLAELEERDTERMREQTYMEAVCARCDQPRVLHVQVFMPPIWVCPTAIFTER